MEIKKTSLFSLAITITATTAFVLISKSAKMRPSPQSYRKTEHICDCDSIKSLLIETDIEKIRYEIIMDRLWEKDTAIYNEVVGNLE